MAFIVFNIPSSSHISIASVAASDLRELSIEGDTNQTIRSQVTPGEGAA